MNKVKLINYEVKGFIMLILEMLFMMLMLLSQPGFGWQTFRWPTMARQLSCSISAP